MKPLTIFFFIVTHSSAFAQLTCPCELEYEDPWALPTDFNMTSSTNETNPLENESNITTISQPNFSYPQWYQEQQNPTPPPTPMPMFVNIEYNIPKETTTSSSSAAEIKPAITVPYSSTKTKHKNPFFKKIKRKVKNIKYSGKCPKF